MIRFLLRITGIKAECLKTVNGGTINVDAKAWRQAVLDLMARASSSDRPAEYYWASFSLSGDWR